MKRVSGIVMLLLLLSSMSILAFSIQPVNAEEPTIYIRADGSVDPPTAPIVRVGDLYVLTDSIFYDTEHMRDYYVAVEKDNVVIDGLGFTLQGPFTGCGIGIYLQYRSNVTIRNMEIRRFSDGISLFHSSYATISENRIAYSNRGIGLTYSSSNTIFGNSIEAISGDGVDLYESSNNRIEKNSITESWSGIGLTSSLNNSLAENNITANTIHGIVLTDSSNNNSAYENEITNNAKDGIKLSDSSSNSINGNNITNNYWGIWVSRSSNNSISGNNMANNFWGIYLESSSNNSIVGNNITDNNYGISLYYSSNYNSINGNNITDNHAVGIGIGLSSGSSSTNSISGNTITNNVFGIGLSEYSSNNSVSGNTIAENDYGISLGFSSDNNSFSGNNITANNNYGIVLYSSSNNRFWHNTIDNTHQVLAQTGGYTNVWDDGYPSGGNYWSNHDCSGNPSNGSQPYIIGADNVDHYPFQEPNGWLRVHNVDTGLNYATIQEAINAPETVEGHMIFVEAGTYYENIVVNKTLSLVGEDPSTTVIDGGGIGDVVYVTAWNVAIKNFQITRSGIYYAPPNSGIRIEANYCNITDNNIIDNSVGVYLYESSYNSIRSNNVTNKYQGITLHDSTNNVISGNNITAHEYIGVTLSWLSYNNTISENNIENNGRGISCADSPHNVISGNSIGNTSPNEGIFLLACSDFIVSGNNIASNSRDGIYLSHSSSISICQNNIKSNGNSGITLFQSSSNDISGNNITTNEGGCGIRLDYSYKNNITGNNMANNRYGICLAASSINCISENNIANNSACGILLYSSSINRIYHNNFIDNTQQVDAEASISILDDGYLAGGNHWSDYTDVDSYSGPYQNEIGSDGIWDHPYVIDRDNRDNYPLICPYWYWSNPIPGDINKDMRVDVKDVSPAARAFGSYPGHPLWNPSVDINKDGKVNVKDIALIARNFGISYK
jgi:parallel beta-helix repeat protein